MTGIRPYYQDEAVALYHGDCRELAPAIVGRADVVIADPPYAETSLAWDAWPQGWVQVAAALAPCMWCFGSMRMFVDRWPDFAAWKFAQELVWEKQNGSSVHGDRFRRVHEYALHFYTGEWSALRREVPQVGEEQRVQRIRRGRTPHLRAFGHDGEISGRRLMRSVVYAANCHGYAVNETQKPEAIVEPLISYSCPGGGAARFIVRRQWYRSCRGAKAGAARDRFRGARRAMRGCGKAAHATGAG
jgi:site-specific DNA-methyltransferase (adenine-specific)